MNERITMPKVDHTITYGDIGKIAAVLVGVTMWLTSGNADTKQAQRDVASVAMQATSLGVQIAEVKRDLTLRLEDLQKNLTPIIQMGVRIDQDERAIADLSRRLDDTNRAVSDANLLAHGVRSDIDNLIRGTAASVMGRK